MGSFLKTVKQQVLIGDGAMGTMLVRQGLPPGCPPELWMLDNTEEIRKIHRAYLEAGSQVIQTNTFGANDLKLQEYSLSDKVEEINITAARLARAEAGKSAFIAGIIGPTGHFPSPLGDVTWDELTQVFSRQAKALAEGGVDFLFLETFSDLGEIRAALFAAKTSTNLPVACSLTYSRGKTLTGTSPEIAAAVLVPLGANLIGANCSAGSQELLAIMKSYRAATHLPLLAEPNAGLPEIINGETVYPETPQEMAAYAEAFRQTGVHLIGACCGSTPEHIRSIANALTSRRPVKSGNEQISGTTRLASRSRLVTLGTHELPQIIGERINPSARKNIAQAYTENNWAILTSEGLAQIKAGASLLDINVGVPGLDEGFLLAEGIRQLQKALDIPLVLDCTNPAALEKGLREYQGKALINSVNGEEKSLATILPLAKKYGAAVLGLTLDEKGIPEKAEERFAVAGRIVERAQQAGLAKEDVLIDCLVLAAAVSPGLAMETVKAISLVKKHLGVTTVLGLSNVSHGLPQRSWLNSTFLALALGAGLDCAIANPLDERIKETIAACALLTGRDTGGTNYLARSGIGPAPGQTSDIPAEPDRVSTIKLLWDIIVNGRQDEIAPLIKELLQKNDIVSLIEQGITPALEYVGELFARGETFLPQLMMSAEAAQKAFACLKESMPGVSGAAKGTIVIGTVKGDIHDIGKNIVAALLESHGYRVIDLGKNVPGECFLAAARKENAQIVGLSALMTTTMTEMGPVIDLIKKEENRIKVIVGGAVVTAEYARKIGADGYGENAVEAVKLVRSLLGQ